MKTRTCSACGYQSTEKYDSFCDSLMLCKPCYQRKWRKENPDKPREMRKRHHVQKSYGLTVEEYDAFVANPCEVCGTDKVPRQVDHDHVTDKLRGALCHLCNIRLGFYETMTPTWLEAAEAYLQAFVEDE